MISAANGLMILAKDMVGTSALAVEIADASGIQVINVARKSISHSDCLRASAALTLFARAAGATKIKTTFAPTPLFKKEPVC